MGALLKLRDQKQIDYEELEMYLAQATKERDAILNPYLSEKGGLEKSIDYLKDKYMDLVGTPHSFVYSFSYSKGTNKAAVRTQKLTDLESRIKQLEEQAEKSKQESQKFSEHVISEIDQWKALKEQDIRSEIRGVCERQVDMYDQGFQIWDRLVQELETKE